MNVGTKSLLFGVHQFLWHPFTVWRAWRHLYGRNPSWRECICIVVHDWGYWGCANMDGPEGETHPIVGAAIAGWLFGPDYYDLVLLHSRSLSKRLGREPSKLCWADKFSMLYDWEPFYLARARLTGELAEYRENAMQYVPLHACDRTWLRWLKARIATMAAEKAREFVHP